MIIKHLKKAIFVIMMLLLLLPGTALAEDEVQAHSNQTFSQEELAQMLSPIALYPDALLSQILMAAAYPFEVAEADRWLTNNPYVSGDALDEALQAKDWDVSILALCHYPKVLTMMSENLSWTARLGDAFTNQEQDVMDSIQELRARAQAAGNLKTTPEQKVIVEERIIRIEPYNYDYFYVPAYDPYYVYGSWWLPLFPPLPIILPGLVITGPGIIFSPRFYAGFGVFGWSFFNWGDRYVYITDIHRTKRFNRHVHYYKGPDRQRWLPDRDRRYVREKRGREIPRFQVPARPSTEIRQLDRKPGAVSLPDQQNKTKDKPLLRDKERKHVGTPGVIKRDKQQQLRQPKTVPNRIPDRNTPRIINRDKVQQQDQPAIEKARPVGQPRIINRNKLQQPGSKTIEKTRPVVRDHSRVEDAVPADRSTLINQRGEAGADRVQQKNMKSGQSFTPRVQRQTGS